MKWLALLLLASLTAPALAQKAQPAAGNYPYKSIRLVVPAAPGGGTDIIGRMIAQGLTDTWGQTVVVDNRGGAGGIAGVTIVANAAILLALDPDARDAFAAPSGRAH